MDGRNWPAVNRNFRPAAQAAEAAMPGAARHDHQQARTRQRRTAGADPRHRTPPAQEAQQLRGELSSADATARTADEALQIGAAGIGFPLCPRPRRRRWSTAEKAAIVAESFTPGAVASMIAL